MKKFEILKMTDEGAVWLALAEVKDGQKMTLKEGKVTHEWEGPAGEKVKTVYHLSAFPAYSLVG